MVRTSEWRNILGSSSNSGGFSGFVILLIAVIVGIASLFVFINRPHSSAGVVTIDDHTARVPAGDSLVLTQTVGKSTKVWTVTWDGEHVVHVDDDSSIAPSHHTDTLCGVDCKVEVEVGWFTDLDVTLRADHTIEVHWPQLWGYQRPPTTTK